MIANKAFEDGGDTSIILPKLYQGGCAGLAQEDFYRSRGITHVVSIGMERPPAHVVDKLGLQTLHINKDDMPSSDFSRSFEETTRFIHEARTTGGTVLVHCFAGVSRSSTITLAYLMSWLDLSYEQALRFLKVQRQAVSPNAGFKRQLLEFQEIDLRRRLSEEMRKSEGWEKLMRSDVERILEDLRRYHNTQIALEREKDEMDKLIDAICMRHPEKNDRGCEDVQSRRADLQSDVGNDYTFDPEGQV